MTKVPTVQSSGASLSAATAPSAHGGGGSAGGRALNAMAMTRPASTSRLCARTIVETAACPPELKRGEQPW